ncbi:hypothetical protein GGI19_004657 [Coemansia pectinata]|uniref:Uncharacterized protein n=1 Tax=Coemansia pectinata TaxID=1052879 RepID=A0A9W8GVU9_9FUNG|nr:hypothetical protein GGI19_004657 [Coemansia pectinata]
MDEFVSTVENQVIALHPLDTQAAFLNIPYHFFFGNNDTADDFMPSDVIRLSFYRALKQFPILAGYLRPEGQGQTSVVIDRDDLNMPEYVESLSDTHYDTLRESNFHHSSWPKGLTRAGAITMAAPGPAGRIQLANVHVVRLKDNSGVIIFINIPHYVVDGTGFFSFVELWGKHCRAERTGDRQLAQQTSQLEYCFDRSIIARHLPVERKPLDAETLRVYTGFKPIADWIAWLSPNTRSRLLNKAKFNKGVVSHTFRVSRHALDLLRKEVSEYVADSSDGKLTDRYLLAAILSKLVARAHRNRREQDGVSVAGWLFGAACSVVGAAAGLVKYGVRLLCCSSNCNSSSKRDSSKYQSLNLLDDVRHGLGLVDKQYMGNGLIPHNSLCPLDVLETPIDSKSLAKAVDMVRSIYENADAALVASFVDLLSSNPKSFTRPMIYMSTQPELLVVTCEMEFKLYASDFGNGPPEWVCTIPSFVANFVGLLPSPPPSTDVIANIILKEPVMKHVLRDEFWREFTQIVY